MQKIHAFGKKQKVLLGENGIITKVQLGAF